MKSLAVTFPEEKKHTFLMDITDSLAQQLAPKGRVVAWYMSATTEIISDAVDFSVEGAFANKVSLILKFRNYMTDYKKAFEGLLHLKVMGVGW